MIDTTLHDFHIDLNIRISTIDEVYLSDSYAERGTTSIEQIEKRDGGSGEICSNREIIPS